MASTLIITLKIEEEIQSFLEEKRKHYFPRYCNFVPAHLTFFHAAPNSFLFTESLKEATAQNEIIMHSNSILPFHNGMAYVANNEYLQDLHAKIQKEFNTQLSGKDRKIWSPHITIQNKVTAFKAHKSYEELREKFTAFNFKVEGFNGYEYVKQKWEFSFFIPFKKL